MQTSRVGQSVSTKWRQTRSRISPLFWVDVAILGMLFLSVISDKVAADEQFRSANSRSQDTNSPPDRELSLLCRLVSKRRDLLVLHERQAITILWRSRELAWHDGKSASAPNEKIRQQCREALGVPAPDLREYFQDPINTKESLHTLAPIVEGAGASHSVEATQAPSATRFEKTTQSGGPKAAASDKRTADIEFEIRAAPRAKRITSVPAVPVPVIKLDESALAPAAGAPVPTFPPEPPTKRIEPWPPPVPTVSAYFGLDVARQGRFKTVGALADGVEGTLTRAGYTEIRYWGAPNGFAIVTRVEPIDKQARPVKGDWMLQHASLDPRQSESIFDYIFKVLRQLLSAPISHSRIFLFVITDDDKIDHPTVSMTPEIGEAWINRGGRIGLTDEQRAHPIGSKHKLIVFIYEFRINQQSEPELLVRDDEHSVEDHLHASRLNVRAELLQ